ncbi:hypothetical protein DFH06DRAFT_61389 [Mycena polygramma]|nr:hypothetical protein DFH06DRAFT_685993 [Mycena polygramma]KAJ7673310.1 hypothetical protein DFH06DRAFT_61389 [Mycena polygramma]
MDVVPAVPMRPPRPTRGLGTRLLPRSSRHSLLAPRLPNPILAAAPPLAKSPPHCDRARRPRRGGRYRTAWSNNDVLLLAPPPVVAMSPAFEVDLTLTLCETSDFDFDFLPAALEDVEDAITVRQTPANRRQRSTNRWCSRQMHKLPAQPCRERAVRA